MRELIAEESKTQSQTGRHNNSKKQQQQQKITQQNSAQLAMKNTQLAVQTTRPQSRLAHQKLARRSPTTTASGLPLSLVVAIALLALQSVGSSSAAQQQQSQQQHQQQQPPASQHPKQNSLLGVEAMNLIPVDQPVGQSASAAGTTRIKLTDSVEAASSFESASLRSGPSGPEANHPARAPPAASSAPQPTAAPLATSNEQEERVAAVHDPTASDSSPGDENELELRSGQRLLQQEAPVEPSSSNDKHQAAAFDAKTAANSIMRLQADSFDGFMSLGAPTEQSPLDATSIKFGQPQQQQVVERRLGLFKKGHFGPPMSANYAAGPVYLGDCERCLASLGVQQQSADLLLQEPLAPPPPAVQPIAVQPQQHLQPTFGAQPFGPLKNKLFMKFPFFMKPISFSGDSGPAPSVNTYNSHESYNWQQPPVYPVFAQASRPAPIGGAVFIRPAPVAYNCAQASGQPQLLASAQSQEVALGTKAATKQQQFQQQHQQTTYSQY